MFERGNGEDTDPTTTITIRLPASLKEALTAEAETKKTSLNKLAVSKLVQPIETENVLSKTDDMGEAWDKIKHANKHVQPPTPRWGQQKKKG